MIISGSSIDLMQSLYFRTHEEFVAGHVEGAFNVPFMFKEETGNFACSLKLDR